MRPRPRPPLEVLEPGRLARKIRARGSVLIDGRSARRRRRSRRLDDDTPQREDILGI
jgi:hypothetical protein